MQGRVLTRRLMLGATLLYLCLAVGNGLDRLSAKSPAIARYVPAAFAAQAHRSRAAEALSGEDRLAALELARDAVRSDPADWRASGLLGGALLAAGSPLSADRAFRVAALFGWRDPLTQLHLMNAALKGSQPSLAAMRLDAVLRQDPDHPLRDMILARFESSADGRAALAARLELRPSWTSQFLGKGGKHDLETLRRRAAVLHPLAGRKWGCDPIAPLVLQLVEAGDAITAKDLWLAHCPAASPGIADGRFTAIATTRQAVPFEWNVQSAGDISVHRATDRSGGIRARITAASSRLTAWQLLTLGPGRYRLGWTALSEGRPAPETATFSLTCVLGERSPLPSQAAGEMGRFAAELQINGQCAQQYLAVWLFPSAQEVLLDEVSLERLP